MDQQKDKIFDGLQLAYGHAGINMSYNSCLWQQGVCGPQSIYIVPKQKVSNEKTQQTK